MSAPVNQARRLGRYRRRASLIDARAEVDLRGADGGEGDHRIANPLQVVDAGDAFAVQPAGGQGPLCRGDRHMPALGHARAEPDLLPQLEG